MPRIGIKSTISLKPFGIMKCGCLSRARGKHAHAAQALITRP